MEKLNGYDEAQAITGEFEILQPGGYICQITGAKEQISSTNKKMLVIAFDICEGDSAGFYKRKYDEAVKNATLDRPAKWSGVYRQMLDGEKSAGYLKGLMTSLEASNQGFKWDWKEEKLKDLKFGGIFGREEYEKFDGTRAFATKLKFIRTIEKVKTGDFKIPEDKLLPEQNNEMNFDKFDSITSENNDLPF